MIDMRREARQIARQFNRYHNQIGESALWFVFDADNSSFDRVYDEAYRRYLAPKRVPLLWVDQQEAPADYAPEGRRPTQRIRLAFGVMALWEAGIDVSEVHGNGIGDRPPKVEWRRDRLNDVMYYGGHFYDISGFQIKGRLKDQDVIVGVSGIEMFPTDEMNLDITPQDWFAPSAETSPPDPEIPDHLAHIVFGEDPPDDPEVGDVWFTPADVISEYDLDIPLAYGGNAPDHPSLGAVWLDTEPSDD